MTRSLPSLELHLPDSQALAMGRARRRRQRGSAAKGGRLLGLLLLLWAYAAQASERLGLEAVLPTVRPEVGLAGQMATTQARYLAVNVNAGAALFFGPSQSWTASDSLVVLPVVGYTFDTSTLHAFSTGVGLGYGSLIVYGALTPRFVVGSLNGERALGVRTGLSAQLLSVLNVELSHQFLSSADLTRHDFGLTVGLDVGSAIFVWLSAFGKH